MKNQIEIILIVILVVIIIALLLFNNNREGFLSFITGRFCIGNDRVEPDGIYICKNNKWACTSECKWLLNTITDCYNNKTQKCTSWGVRNK
jgi:hypothetical protein